MKRRKPDLMLILALVVGLGVLVTGWAQGVFHGSPTHASSAMQHLSQTAFQER